MGAREISNHAADLIAAALAPGTPPGRVYVSRRRSFDLPHALVNVEAEAPSGTVTYDGTLAVHGWATYYGDVSRMADAISAALVGFHVLPDGSGYRLKRPGRSYLSEADAEHVTLRFPLTYDSPL